jgi:predicted RNA-binding Zn-ribbon protein involved in translation (DUF1610 family)
MSRDNHVPSWRARHASKIMGVVLAAMFGAEMAGPIVLASLMQWVTIECPACGYRKRVTRKPVSRRVCPRCRKYFEDPLASQ